MFQVTILRLVAPLLAATPLIGCSSNTPADVKVLDYGLYDAVIVTSGSPSLGQEAQVVAVSGVKHYQTTTTIPAQANTYFGLRLDPKTLPSRFHLRIEIEHPTFWKPGQNPTHDDPVTINVNNVDINKRGAFNGAALWYFLEGMEYEMVPGNWVFRVLIDKQLVAEQAFVVVR